MRFTPHSRTFSASLRTGFTLVELLVYVAVFALIAVFLVGVLTTVARTQVRQISGNEVAQQVSFVANTIQRYVRSASVVENAPGVSTGTLTLRLGSAATNDRVKFYADAGKTAIYLEEIPDGQSVGTAVPLTDGKVSVGQFLVEPYQNEGGSTVVQVDLTLVGASGKPGGQAVRSWRSAIAKVSAATFDSNVLPSSGIGPNRSIGTALLPWQDLYLSGNVTVNGTVGIGTTPPSLPARLRAAGDVGVTTSSAGIVLTAPNGTSCYRIGVSNSGLITTSTASCPGSW